MRKSDPFSVCLPLISCGLGLIYPALCSLSSLRFPVISEHSLLYYTLWIMVLYPLPYCTQVAYKKRQRANKRREMETLMRDNLLNILTVPGKKIDQSIFKFFSLYLYFIRDWHRRYRNSVQFRPIYPMQTKLQLTVKLNLQVEVTLVGKQSHLWINKTANLGIGEVKKRYRLYKSGPLWFFTHYHIVPRVQYGNGWSRARMLNSGETDPFTSRRYFQFDQPPIPLLSLEILVERYGIF